MKSLLMFVCFAATLLLNACNGENVNTDPKTGSSEIKKVSSKMSELIPGYYEADSLQIVFYDDPIGDSLRYNRFFSYRVISDKQTIKTFLENMDVHCHVQDSMRPCRSEGKIILLKGEEVLKTVYFSNQSPDCSYVYLIRDGRFYYGEMAEGLEK